MNTQRNIVQRVARRLGQALLVPALAGGLALWQAPAARAGAFDDAMVIATDPGKLALRTDEAIRLFRSAIDSGDHKTDAAYNVGLILMRQGDRNGARSAWQKAVEAKADHLPAQAQLAGLDLADPAKAPAAVQALEAIVKIDRFQPEARNHLASWEISQGRYDEAIRHGRNALLGDPENINAFLNVAIAYFKKGLPDQAGLIASSALEKNTKAASLHNLLGLVFLSQDNSRSATEAFTAALGIDPDNNDARLNLASLELNYGNFESALKRFDQVLQSRPNDASVTASRAVALRGLGRYDDAEKGYKAALAMPNAEPDIAYNLCILHHQYTQRWADALKSCNDFLARVSPSHSKYTEVTRRVKAIEATLRALQTKPQ